MTAVKLETNFASFPEVRHDDRLELRDRIGLLPEDLGVCVSPEVEVEG